MGLPCLYQLEPKWKEKSYHLLSEKRDCGGFMEPNLGARRTTKHMWKLQAEPQWVWRAHRRTKLISARTSLHLNVLQNKGSLPKRATRTNPTMSIFGTKSALTSNPPTHRLTLWSQGMWILDHNHWSHGVSRKKYPILPRWHYASWSVHWHSSLYLQCRRKV